MSENNGGSGLRLKTGLAEMLKGGVIMDVMSAAQAEVAEKAGAVAVMALERVPAMIRATGGVARMANPKLIREIMDCVSIPVMAKCRIGHFAEAQVLQELGVDYIDESEVLTPADEAHHVDKHAFKVPFVCGARNLGEALRRIGEGAALIRTKGEAGTGDVVHAVKHMRQIMTEMRQLTVMGDDELSAAAKNLQAPYELVRLVAKAGKLPVPNFSAGGIATPADAALMMQLGAESVFVGSGIFMKDGTTPLEVGYEKRPTQESRGARRCGIARPVDRDRDHALQRRESRARGQHPGEERDEGAGGSGPGGIAVAADTGLVKKRAFGVRLRAFGENSRLPVIREPFYLGLRCFRLAASTSELPRTDCRVQKGAPDCSGAPWPYPPPSTSPTLRKASWRSDTICRRRPGQGRVSVLNWRPDRVGKHILVRSGGAHVIECRGIYASATASNHQRRGRHRDPLRWTPDIGAHRAAT